MNAPIVVPAVKELFACCEFFKEGITIVDPFEKLPCSELSANFVGKFGVQWGFPDRAAMQHIK